MYNNFKESVLGKPVLTVQGVTNPYGVECVTLIWLYVSELFPSVSFKNSLGQGNANTLFNSASTTYFEKIVNDHANASQVPEQGDIMVFAGTPQSGYTDTYPNPYGHTGVCDSASSTGYGLLAQNSPEPNEAPNVTEFAWKYRPCIGWLRPVGQAPVAQYYIVVKGDTVDGICSKHNLTVAKFQELNPTIKNLNVISIGEKVRIA